VALSKTSLVREGIAAFSRIVEPDPSCRAMPQLVDPGYMAVIRLTPQRLHQFC